MVKTIEDYAELVKTCEGKDETHYMLKFVDGVCDKYFPSVACDMYDLYVGIYKPDYIKEMSMEPSRGLIVCRACASRLGLIW